MLNNTKDLYGIKLVAPDGAIGRVKDFYFDDWNWVIRYLIADTGAWLPGRLTLLSPHALGEFNPYEYTLQLKLTKKQIEDSPVIESHRPVSRQLELEYYHYYGWPAYWEGSALWGVAGFPAVVPPPWRGEPATRPQHYHRTEKHLQSVQALTGYHIQTTDGTVGHVTGFLVDDKTWAVRQIAVETGQWLDGREIHISPDRVERISYPTLKVFVRLTKADILQTLENHLVHAGLENPGAENFPPE